MEARVSIAKSVNLDIYSRVAENQRSVFHAVNIWTGALIASNPQNASIAKVVMSYFSEHAQEVGSDYFYLE